MLLAYKAEYEHTDISIPDLLKKYQLDKGDIEGHEEWMKSGDLVTTLLAQTKGKKQNIVDKMLTRIESNTVQPVTHIENIVMVDHIASIDEFKTLALAHCLKFMRKDAQFSEVKEFKDIVAIVDSLEKSYQKADPDAGKPTINILINNLMERFQDDC